MYFFNKTNTKTKTKRAHTHTHTHARTVSICCSLIVITLTSVITWICTKKQIRKKQRIKQINSVNFNVTAIDNNKNDNKNKKKENIKLNHETTNDISIEKHNLRKKKNKLKMPVMFSADTWNPKLNPNLQILFLPGVNTGENLLQYYTAEQIVDFVVNGLGDLVLKNKFSNLISNKNIFFMIYFFLHKTCVDL